MKSRQVVCSDPEVLKRMASFVPTIGDPQQYREGKKDVLEYKLVYEAMLQTPFVKEMDHWHVQGLYFITPSGKLIAGANSFSDSSATLKQMDLALERYSKMSRAERLLPKAPDPEKDRVAPVADGAKAPADGLVLRMVSRGLPCEGMSLKDTRHEFFYKLDHVWYTKDEARAFLPAQVKMGAKEAVKKPVLNRLVRLYLGVYVQPNLYWQPEDVKEATLVSEVTGAKDDTIEVRFSGKVRMDSPSNKRTFEAELLGKATYKVKTLSFSAFELLGVGTHALGPTEQPIEGSPRVAPMGILFTLNGKNSNDQVPPSLYSLYNWASSD